MRLRLQNSMYWIYIYGHILALPSAAASAAGCCAWPPFFPAVDDSSGSIHLHCMYLPHSRLCHTLYHVPSPAALHKRVRRSEILTQRQRRRTCQVSKPGSKCQR